MNTMKYPSRIALLISISLCACVAAAVADEDWNLRRSKLIAALEVDRQLAGSKSSKASAGKASKASRQSAKSDKSAQIKATSQAEASSDKPAPFVQPLTLGSKSSKAFAGKGSKAQADTSLDHPSADANNNQPLRPHAIFNGGKGNKSVKNNSSKSGKSVKAVEGYGSAKSSTASHPAPESMVTAPVPKVNPVPESTVTVITSKVNLITPPSSLDTEVPSQDHSFSNTRTDSSDVEILTQFLEGNGDYTGLRTQNLVVGISGVLALLATIVGVAVTRRKRTSNIAENKNDNNATVLDSVEISPAVAVQRKASTTSTNATSVDNPDYSCTADLFGLTSCWL